MSIPARLSRFTPAIAAAFALAACASPRPVRTAAAAPAPAPAAARQTRVAAAPSPAAKSSLARESKRSRVAVQPTLSLWGVVVSLDAGTGRLTIKNKHGRIHELTISARTRVTEGGADKGIPLSQVRPGDLVIVRASGDIARTVHVRVLDRHRRSSIAKAR